MPTPNTTTDTAVEAHASPEPADDTLEALEPAKLAAMLRDKRKSEASLRTRLRETETERDALRGQVDGHHQHAVTEAATAAGLLPEAATDLAQAVNVADVLTDDGSVDGEKLQEALGKLRTDRPHWFTRPASSSGVDHAGGSGEAPPTAPASWSDVLTG